MSTTTLNKNTLQQTDAFMQKIIAKNPNETEFHQAVHEVAESVIPYILDNDIYQKEKVLERLVEPDRILIFQSMLGR